MLGLQTHRVLSPGYRFLFAWYTAQSAGKIGTVSGAPTPSLTVTKEEYNIGNVNFDNVIKIEASFATTDDAALELAVYNASATDTTTHLSAGYLDKAGEPHLVAGKVGTGTVLYGTVTVTASVNAGAFTNDIINVGGNDYTKEWVIEQLAGQKIYATVAPATSSRARVFTSSAAEDDPDTPVVLEITLTSLTASSTHSATCYAYVLGTNTSADTADSFSAGLTVSASNTNPNN